MGGNPGPAPTSQRQCLALTLGVVGQAHKGYISDETVRGSLIREGLPLTKNKQCVLYYHLYTTSAILQKLLEMSTQMISDTFDS